MLFNRTKDKATLSFLQVSKYWDGSFDRESLLPWTWLANMQVSHLSARPNHSVSNWILFLQAAPGPSPHLWPSSHALPLSNVLAWMPGLGGPCASSVLPQVTLQLTGLSPVDLPSSPQSFSTTRLCKMASCTQHWRVYHLLVHFELFILLSPRDSPSCVF